MSEEKPVTYWVYNALATVLLLIGLPFLPVLYLLGKRYRMGLGQRLGFYGREVRGAVNRYCDRCGSMEPQWAKHFPRAV